MGPPSTLGRLLVMAVVMPAAMCVALVAVNLIPRDPLLAHVRSTISRVNFPPSQLGDGTVDFFDECVAATVGLGQRADRLPLIRRAFLSPVIGNCDEFQAYIDGDTTVGFDYWRYWHGYQILTRPLLYLFGLGTVHYVFFALYLLAGTLFVSQVSRFSPSCMWSAVIAYLCVPAAPQIASPSHAMVWVIAFGVGGWILRPSTSHAKAPGHLTGWFLALGMLCAFFDLFTVPLITLTVPLLGLYWKGQFDPRHPKLTVGRICVLSAVWLAGYAICWATKWTVVYMIGGVDVIAELSKVIKHRIGIGSGPLGDFGDQMDVSAARSILSNLRVCRHGLLILAVVAIARIRPLAAAALSRRNWSVSAIAVPLVLLLMPVIWLAVVQQHSIWHAWFVARIYFTSFAVVLAMMLTPRGAEATRRERT